MHGAVEQESPFSVSQTGAEMARSFPCSRHLCCLFVWGRNIIKEKLKYGQKALNIPRKSWNSFRMFVFKKKINAKIQLHTFHLPEFLCQKLNKRVFLLCYIVTFSLLFFSLNMDLWIFLMSSPNLCILHTALPLMNWGKPFQIISLRTYGGFSNSWVNAKSSCGGIGAQGSPPAALVLPPLPSPCSASHMHLLLPLPRLHLPVWWP